MDHLFYVLKHVLGLTYTFLYIYICVVLKEVIVAEIQDIQMVICEDKASFTANHVTGMYPRVFYIAKHARVVI